MVPQALILNIHSMWVSIIVTARDRSHGLPSLWQHIKLSDVSLGTCPRYSLVAGKNVKTPIK